MAPILSPDRSAVDETQIANERDALALSLANLASRAGEVVMAIYEEGFTVELKDDGSPLTRADLAADALVAQGLQAIAPDIPVLSEETADSVPPESLGSRFFVVDPLDGTKEFVLHNGEFSINIALVEDGVPHVGVVYAPAHHTIWIGGSSAFAGQVVPGETVTFDDLHPIKTCGKAHTPVKAVASRSHLDEKTDGFLKSIAADDMVQVGSALKFCLVADGTADVYPRYSDTTMVWDTAAGVAVVQAAGGVVLDEAGDPMRVAFGPKGWRNGGFTAWGCEQIKT